MQQDQRPSPQQVFLQTKAAFKMGDYFEASKQAGLLRAHLAEHPPVLAIHGIVFSRLGLDIHAIADLERAAELTEEALTTGDDQNPARPQIIDQIINVCVAWCRSLVRLGEPDQAIEVIDRALAHDPERPDAIAAKAEALDAKGDSAGALRLIDKGISDGLDVIQLGISKGRIALRSDGKPDAGLISMLREQTDRVGLHGCDLIDALRVLGDLEDRAGEYDNAFGAYRRAANLRRGDFNPEAHAKMTGVLIQKWTHAEMDKLTKSEADGSSMVMMVGAPCSGINELGDALGQASDVTTIGPTDALGMVAMKVFGAKNGVLRPVVLSPTGLMGKQLNDGAKGYAGQVGPLIAQGTARAIDTNHMNVWNVGLAALMFPGIRIVVCRRDPRACALDCYTADLPGQYPYAGDLVHAASYIADCNRMMDHWSTLLADGGLGCEMIEVDYEDLVNDLQGSAKKLAKSIGASGVETIGDPNLTIRKSPDPNNYRMKMSNADELLGALIAGN